MMIRHIKRVPSKRTANAQKLDIVGGFTSSIEKLSFGYFDSLGYWLIYILNIYLKELIIIYFN